MSPTLIVQLRTALALKDAAAMKFGFRAPSLRKMLAARLSPRRQIQQRLGLRAPRGWGWLTNPRRAAYNRVYSRSTLSVLGLLKALFGGKRR